MIHLILSVIPDGNVCLRTSLCTLKHGKCVVIFDKFLPEEQFASPGRRFINIFSALLGTDINRRLRERLIDCPCRVVHDEPSIGRGIYLVILLQKNESTVR